MVEPIRVKQVLAVPDDGYLKLKRFVRRIMCCSFVMRGTNGASVAPGKCLSRNHEAVKPDILCWGRPLVVYPVSAVLARDEIMLSSLVSKIDHTGESSGCPCRQQLLWRCCVTKAADNAERLSIFRSEMENIENEMIQ